MGQGGNEGSELYDGPGSAPSLYVAGTPATTAPVDHFNALQWSRTDTLAISGLLLVALALRLWHLAQPAVIVFDENFTVSMARCYLSHLPYRATHPPLPSLLIALSIGILGDNPWGWRLPNALVGTALVGITYLLGRRMFDSRLAGAFAAVFVTCDGLFLVDSRIALWEIFYLTFAACAYLTLFRFARRADALSGRRALAWMGFALGLCLGSKLLIPAVTVLLVIGFVVVIMVGEARAVGPNGKFESNWDGQLAGKIGGALALVGGLSGFVYLALFLPQYWFGWWHGIADQVTYYRGVFYHQRALSGGTHPYASPWWSWPLMLRPIGYWFKDEFFVDPNAPVAAIRALGNPVIWWGAVVSVPLVAIRAIIQKNLAKSFLVVGYVAYLSMWIPIARYQFVYYYMPALYMGFLALAAMLAECWQGKSQSCEHATLMGALLPAIVLGVRAIPGTVLAAVIAGAYLVLVRRSKRDAGIFVAVLFVASVLIAFVYFFPIWTGLPVSAAGFRHRMWLHGPGLANWI